MEVMKQAKVAFGGMLAACVVAIVCLLAIPANAFAYEPVTVELPVTIAVDGNVPDEPETFEVVLEAVDDGALMPAGAEGSSCSIFVNGGTSGAFDAITFDKPCVWSYYVTQISGTNDLGIYDSTRYYVTVSITNDENGELARTVAVHPDGSEEKLAEIVFSNYYDEPLPDTGGLDGLLPQTGDELMKIIVLLAVVVCIAAAICVAIIRRSKIQRAGHRR